MACHIVADIPFAHPIECTREEILSQSTPRYIGSPFLDIGILTIAEL